MSYCCLLISTLYYIVLCRLKKAIPLLFFGIAFYFYLFFLSYIKYIYTYILLHFFNPLIAFIQGLFQKSSRVACFLDNCLYPSISVLTNGKCFVSLHLSSVDWLLTTDCEVIL